MPFASEENESKSHLSFQVSKGSTAVSQNAQILNEKV